MKYINAHQWQGHHIEPKEGSLSRPSLPPKLASTRPYVPSPQVDTPQGLANLNEPTHPPSALETNMFV